MFGSGGIDGTGGAGDRGFFRKMLPELDTLRGPLFLVGVAGVIGGLFSG